MKITIEAGEADSCRIDHVALRALAAAMIARAGIVPEDAALLADALVTADARGMHSHGLLRLPVYLDRIRAGGFASKPAFEIVRETGAPRWWTAATIWARCSPRGRWT